MHQLHIICEIPSSFYFNIIFINSIKFDFDFVVEVTATIVDYSFDSVKVCLQTQTLNYRLYSDSLDYFIKITRQESILEFYKDMSSSMFAVAIIN
ncbi:unnamed protein product [Rotaria sordida]|uniref:Uncharacterized protein n=1 Tax=Rotaria sordida TaxID=392033 RepID=A0A815XUH9_9BILA|nr:unnamed protein product [Rotaria sordida]CAF1561888.1 unnamed protein product [Rotaria sordida]